MSRALYLSMKEADVISKCADASVGISAIERLPKSGVRLVCMSVHGAEVMRTKLKSHLMQGTVERVKFRPSNRMW
jgi:hypothetical protein